MIELRPYQVEVIGEVPQVVAAGYRRVIVVAPTGSGKTIISAQIIKGAVAVGKRVLVLAHTREIIRQTSLKLVWPRHRARDHTGWLGRQSRAGGAGREHSDIVDARNAPRPHADAAGGLVDHR
jgi:superfamily II DNA or RNA helicase